MKITMKMDGFLRIRWEPPQEPHLMDRNGLKSVFQKLIKDFIGLLGTWLKFQNHLKQESMFCHSDGIVNRVHKCGMHVQTFMLSDLKYEKDTIHFVLLINKFLIASMQTILIVWKLLILDQTWKNLQKWTNFKQIAHDKWFWLSFFFCKEFNLSEIQIRIQQRRRRKLPRIQAR